MTWDMKRVAFVTFIESSCPLSAFPGVSIELKIMIIVSENKLPKNWVV